MTITNDERHEVAARLREDIGLHAFAEIFGFSWTDGRDWYWRDVTAKVADYVEPEPERTCKMYRDEHGTWHCESCENGGDNITGSDGVLDMWYDSWHPNFCPHCGCKVIV